MDIKARIEIQDGGELNWPIEIPNSFAVADVRVTVRGLYHDDASDVRIRLLHDDEGATLFDASESTVNQGFGVCSFGTPENVDAPPDFSALSRGFEVGVDLFFTDSNTSLVFADDGNVNAAFGRPTSQSSTAATVPSATAAEYELYDSSKATDGFIDGIISEVSVAMTAEDKTFEHGLGDGNPWWEVDLQDNVTIGSVYVWGRNDEPVIVRPEVQRIYLNASEWFEEWESSATTSSNGLDPNNWFTLRFDDGLGNMYETRAIASNAPACGPNGCTYADNVGTRYV